ncbi:MAG: MarR family transcriptional regulator [Phycisphaerae bacterium]
MTTTVPNSQLQAMAEEIFALTVMAWRDRLASRGGGAANELSESQFLTLDLLHRHATLTVGEIQRAIGVLPAQMSRIIRSLETSFDKPLIRCELNQQDKRKIDVALTAPGRKIYDEFRSSRLGETQKILSGLPESDRADFVRICSKIKALYHTRKDGAPTPGAGKAE